MPTMRPLRLPTGRRPARRLGARLGAATLLAAVAAGCSGGSGADPQASPTYNPSERPSSTASISIVEPKPGAVVQGGNVLVKVAVEGATILDDPNNRPPKPDEGHVHILLDGQVVVMTFGTEQEIPVEPGPHLLTAQFVAGDHLPFNPMVEARTTFTAQ